MSISRPAHRGKKEVYSNSSALLNLEFNQPQFLHGRHRIRKRSFLTIAHRFPPQDSVRQGLLFGGFVETKSNRNYYERSIEVGDWGTVYQLINREFNTYISMAQFFRPKRAVANVCAITCLFCDIDFKLHPPLKQLTAAQAVKCIRDSVRERGFPDLSFIESTGGGYHAYIVFSTPVDGYALSRWRELEDVFVECLLAIGGDPICRDAARILRLDGTKNTKTGTYTVPAWLNVNLFGEYETADFESLYRKFFPAESKEEKRIRLEKKEVERRLREKRALEWNEARTVLPEDEKSVRRFGFTARSLNWTRFVDLRTLCELRGGFPEGHREIAVFLAMVFFVSADLARLGDLEDEAFAIACIFGGEMWAKTEWKAGNLISLRVRAQAAAKGETIKWEGKKVSPIYRYTNIKIIQLLEISEDEQRQLRTIKAKTISRAQANDKRREGRRKTGVDRETYERESLAARKPWEAIGMSRRDWYRKGRPEA